MIKPSKLTTIPTKTFPPRKKKEVVQEETTYKTVAMFRIDVVATGQFKGLLRLVVVDKDGVERIVTSENNAVIVRNKINAEIHKALYENR